MFLILVLAGCSLLGDGGGSKATPPSVALPQTESDETSRAGGPPSAGRRAETATSASVVPQRPPGCHHFFSEEDANQAFAVASAAQGDCAFEGVRVNGSQMAIRYKPDVDSEVQVMVQSAACDGDGDVVGGLRFDVPSEAEKACPKAVETVRNLARTGSLPTGTEGTFGR